MKKLLLASLMLLSASAFGHSTGVGPASAEIEAIATVIPQITLSQHSPLDFGILLPGEKHNTELQDQGKEARINVFGKGEGQNVTGAKVLIGSDPSVTLIGNGADIVANLKVGTPKGGFFSGTGGVGKGSIKLSSSGHSHFNVHGAMVNGTDQSGFYTGTFTVFARYDQKFPM